MPGMFVMKRLHCIMVRKKSLILGAVLVLVCLAAVIAAPALFFPQTPVAGTGDGASYIILAASPSGMKCYQSDFSVYMLLPPGSDLRAQVIRREGEETELVTGGIEVRYEIISNTTSAGKTNFWEYAADYGYDVEPDKGITGSGLSGTMKLSEDGRFYEAKGIPLTPYNDGSNTPNPYQLARITVTDTRTGKVLAGTDEAVVPVSDEMECGMCHGRENTDMYILRAHDRLLGTDLVQRFETGNRPACINCHREDVLGQPDKEGAPPFSEAIHGSHADRMDRSETEPVCYSCHPGPVAKCYRGRMYLAGISCGSSECHGSMSNVSKTQAGGRAAWAQEPDCGQCHGSLYAANAKKLYRDSFLNNSDAPAMNGILLCTTCHNSPHAEWRSSLPKDNLLPTGLLGYPNFIDKCSACHEGMGMGRVHAGSE